MRNQELIEKTKEIEQKKIDGNLLGTDIGMWYLEAVRRELKKDDYICCDVEATYRDTVMLQRKIDNSILCGFDVPLDYIQRVRSILEGI